MAISWVTPVRIAQAVCAVIVLGTSGYLVSQLNSYNVDSATFDFNVFTAVWTLLVCAFFIVTGFMADSFLANPIICLAVDGLTWVFWLAAFAAAAAKLDYVESLFIGGNIGDGPLAGSLKATVAFGVIEWLLFSATLIWNAMSGFRGKSSGGAAPAHQGV